MPQLEEILAASRSTLPGLRIRAKAIEAAARARPVPGSFPAALRGPSLRVIAEVKRRSPSVGAINEALDPVQLALAYQRGGAAAISVLTEGPHFGGAIADLEQVVSVVSRPVLRKDFILDELQLLEARASGASAALLIVRALDDATLRRLDRFAGELGLATLVEAHTLEELDRALAAGARIIGVNARNLDTFAIDTRSAWELLARIPASLTAVAESGMKTAEDVALAAQAGADAVLIGTALAASGDPEAAMRALSEVPTVGR
jgi:indole-3-glycerol phosphate synthase